MCTSTRPPHRPESALNRRPCICVGLSFPQTPQTLTFFPNATQDQDLVEPQVDSIRGCSRELKLAGEQLNSGAGKTAYRLSLMCIRLRFVNYPDIET